MALTKERKITLMINFLFTLLLFSCAQEEKPPEPFAVSEAHRQFYEAHERFLEATIRDRRFKHADLSPLIRALGPPFEVSLAGRSVEDREIFRVKLGRGPTVVLLWSQMHGDEATATMALMDIFNFFQASGDGFDDYRREVLDKLTLYFIPMLNPDGAELFRRRNALDIDLNRDALRLTSPEAQLLKRVRDEVGADWGFNLHDQSFYYAVGDNPRQASISFLAPAYNEAKEVNEVRGNAMLLIACLNQVLQAYIPGQVGKYSDDFEERAFGDNIQKWGTSTVLVETGGLYGDPEKQELRRLNFTLLLAAFQQIADRTYLEASLSAYDEIPFNNYGAFQDLILRGLEMPAGDKWYTVDIAFQHQEVEYDRHSSYYYHSRITDIGHLSNFFAFRDLDAQGYRALPGRAYSKTLKNAGDLKTLPLLDLVGQGVTDFYLEDWPKDNRYHTLPVRLLPGSQKRANEIRIGANPSLLLQKDGKTDYLVVNGFLHDLRDREQIEKMLSVATR